MATRSQVRALLETGMDHAEVSARLGIPPGQVYMIATGLPADGSDVPSQEELNNRDGYGHGVMAGGSQALANPPTENPTRNQKVEQWIRARALADRPMQAAARHRTAEPPEPLNDDAEDVVTILRTDHNQVKYIQEQLEATPGVRQGAGAVHQQQRVSLVDMLRVRLSEHETAEEEHFWPAIRQQLEDGDQLADEALAQEQQGKDLLQALDGRRGDEDEFDELVEQLVLALRKHVAFEDSVFLKAEAAIDLEQRRELGRKLQRAKKHAPTRPHPHAPDRPPLDKAAGAVAAPLDHLRDVLGRPADRSGQAEDGGRAPADREQEGQ